MKIKNVYLVGGTYNLKEQSAEGIEKSIQANLDRWTKPGLMKVKVFGGKHYLELRVYRKYRENYKVAFPFDDEKMLPSIDSDILLGRFGENVKLPVMPPSVPYGYLFNYEITEFIKIYKKNVKAMGLTVPKNISVQSTPSYVAINLAC